MKIPRKLTTDVRKLSQLHLKGQISRREFLRLSAVLSATYGSAAFLAACGVPTTEAPPAATEAPAEATEAPVAEATEAPAEPTEAPAEPTAVPEVAPLLLGRDLSDIISLDPHRAFESTYLLTDKALYDTLVTYANNDFETLLPSLATDWQVADDATAVTFTLREGVKFASGNPLTADVFKWSLERLRDMQGQPAYLMEPVIGIEAPDDLTLTVSLSRPDATILSRFASPYFVPLDRDLVMQNGGANDETDTADVWLTEHSAGTGPYQIGEFRRDERLDLTANPNAWSPPEIDRAFFRHFGDPAPMRLALEQGEIEIIGGGLPSDNVEELRGAEGVVIAEAPSFQTFYVGWTSDPAVHEALANPLVGQALKYAFDYEGYKQLFPGSVRPASPVALGLGGALPEEEGIPHDPDRAMELLAEAGYPNGFDVEVATLSSTFAGYSFALVAEKVQQDLVAVGINATLAVEEDSVFLTAFRAGDKPLSVVVFLPDYPDAGNPLEFYSPLGPWGNRSRGFSADTVMAEAMTAALSIVDTEERLEKYREIQRMMVERTLYQVLFQTLLSIPHRDNLTGVYADALTFFVPQLVGRA